MVTLRNTFTIDAIRKKAGYDADALSFITAASLTDATQKTAINDLVVGLKAKSIWPKMKAIYPVIGGSASTHKFNLKDPRDLDAAFRLVYAGGWTHAATGMKPNGTNGYSDTFFIPNTELTNISGHLSFYNRTQSNAGSPYDIAGSDNSSAIHKATFLITRYNTNLFYFGYGNGGYGGNILEVDGRGYYVGNRLDGTNSTLWKNGLLVKTVAQIVSMTVVKLFIGAHNGGGTANLFSNKECAFATLGDGLTPTDQINLNTLVQDYQTTLGRNV